MTIATDQRLEDIKHWIESDLNINDYQLKPASEDASFRRYFRLSTESASWVIMDAPPDKENCEPFIKVAQLIENAQVQSPHIFCFNRQQGFMQLSDLGSTAYLTNLNAETVDLLYADAIHAIVKMQSIQADLPAYDMQLLKFEMNLFKDWYLGRHLNIQLTESQETVLTTGFNLLAKSALQQDVAFVHRDYHSRNLMITENNNSSVKNPGVIDFQDAVNGPITYDLVSLIKDCYIAWPRKKQLQWIDQFIQFKNLKVDKQSFIKQLDLMGMQRHLKAIGIFSRLKYRDEKPAYLNDIPRTLSYVLDVCQRYDELSEFNSLLSDLGISADKNMLDKIQ